MRLALARGLGRALLHVRNHGMERDRELVLAAALHNQTYDPQCEGSRADWMHEFLDERLAEAFLDRAGDVGASFWDALQQRRLLFLLARGGRGRARELLYAGFRAKPDSDDLIGGEEILKLDGAAGLRECLRRLRSQEPAERLAGLAATLGDLFDTGHGEGSALPLIQEELLDWRPALADRRVRSLDNFFPRAGKSERTLPDLTRTMEQIEGGRSSGYYLGYLGKLVGEEQAEPVFERLLQERNAPRLARCLEFFARRGFPRVCPRLLELADHPSERVRFSLVQGLSRHQGEEVRQLALRCLKRRRWRSGEVGLLENNYRSGDVQVLLPVLVSDDHRLIADLVDVCKQNAHPELLPVLIYVYEVSLCLNCRDIVIDIMRELGILPGWIEEEHACDALTFSP